MMNRRDAFKLFVAGAVSLLGAKGLSETLRGPEMVRGISDVQSLGSVMGEQAHWPTEVSVQSSLTGGRLHNARVVAAKIDGEWVDTSDWTPEQIAAIEPGVLKQAPADGIKKTPIPVKIGQWGTLDG